MRAIIDSVGSLQVERAGKMKTQYCPFSSGRHEGWIDCGDWCPAFEEGGIGVQLSCLAHVTMYIIHGDARAKKEAS